MKNNQTNTENANHEQMVKNLLAAGETVVRVDDGNDEAYTNGWANYLMDNFEYSNMRTGFRAYIDQPKKHIS